MHRKFDFNDILITPKTHTPIRSRYREINPFYSDVSVYEHEKKLPVFTAPMDSVIDYGNLELYNQYHIRGVIPRTNTYQDWKNNTALDIPLPTGTFISFGLDDFEKLYCEKREERIRLPQYVLIDIANGHMDIVLELAKVAKRNYPFITIMAGNIANPNTYMDWIESGVIDYARIGIGNGGGCLTTQQTGIGYPMGSLISECYKIKQAYLSDPEGYPNPTKIIADGGMKDYSDIIKALALGADYAMIGTILNKAFESSGEYYTFNYEYRKISEKKAKKYFENGTKDVFKKYYGMSTKIAQKKMGNDNVKTSEGVVRYRKVEYTLEGWHANFFHYLMTAMSYSNAKTLDEFIGKADYNFITENAFRRFNK